MAYAIPPSVPYIVLDDEDEDDEVQITGILQKNPTSNCLLTDNAQKHTVSAGIERLREAAVTSAGSSSEAQNSEYDREQLPSPPASSVAGHAARTFPPGESDEQAIRANGLPKVSEQGTPVFTFGPKFFVGMANKIALTFPYEEFAREQQCSLSDVNNALLATVVGPLLSSNDPVSIQGEESAPSLMSKWYEKYLDMVNELQNNSTTGGSLPAASDQSVAAADTDVNEDDDRIDSYAALFDYREARTESRMSRETDQVIQDNVEPIVQVDLTAPDQLEREIGDIKLDSEQQQVDVPELQTGLHVQEELASPKRQTTDLKLSAGGILLQSNAGPSHQIIPPSPERQTTDLKLSTEGSLLQSDADISHQIGLPSLEQTKPVLEPYEEDEGQKTPTPSSPQLYSEESVLLGSNAGPPSLKRTKRGLDEYEEHDGQKTPTPSSPQLGLLSPSPAKKIKLRLKVPKTLRDTFRSVSRRSRDAPSPPESDRHLLGGRRVPRAMAPPPRPPPPPRPSFRTLDIDPRILAQIHASSSKASRTAERHQVVVDAFGNYVDAAIAEWKGTQLQSELELEDAFVDEADMILTSKINYNFDQMDAENRRRSGLPQKHEIPSRIDKLVLLPDTSKFDLCDGIEGRVAGPEWDHIGVNYEGPLEAPVPGAFVYESD